MSTNVASDTGELYAATADGTGTDVAVILVPYT